METKSITKIFEFSAAHQLYNDAWDEAENRRVFGECADLHGHNYRLEVCITGPVDAESGMIVNFRELSRVVNNCIIADVDHKNLNRDITWLEGKMTTAEVVVEEIWKRLSAELGKELPTVRLSKLVLWENSTSHSSIQNNILESL